MDIYVSIYTILAAVQLIMIGLIIHSMHRSRKSSQRMIAASKELRKALEKSIGETREIQRHLAEMKRPD